MDILDCTSRGDFSGVQKLLNESKYLVHTKDKFGWEPLHEAVANGYSTITEILLKAGANIESPDIAERRPLHLAVMCGSLETVIMLTHYRADIEAKINGNWTPLYYAVVLKNIDVIRHLILQGANVKDYYGKEDLMDIMNENISDSEADEIMCRYLRNVRRRQ